MTLETLTVKEPCARPWSSLRGTGRVRLCDGCDQRVYNLGALSRERALALLHRNHGKGQLIRRADGTVVTRDCRSTSSQAF